jgi:hypothetical protein
VKEIGNKNPGDRELTLSLRNFPSFTRTMIWLISPGRGNSREILALESKALIGPISKIHNCPPIDLSFTPKFGETSLIFAIFWEVDGENPSDMAFPVRFPAHFTSESMEQEVLHNSLALGFAKLLRR